MGKLTTHIIDTAQGCPAAGIPVEIYRIGQPTTLLISFHSNSDGRSDGALLEGRELCIGEYEFVFYIAKYFSSSGLALPDPPFLDRIAIRFSVADPLGRYHVPLLVSPWGYSTYRGS
ncbi:hydroxyisourate hydrolase [Sulfuriferula sp. GW1]|uniref:hydroxyisourate hydrolase n=1 Tax=Sulfuriferula sp. GW1 TaxID=3345111 RepID=UPI0039AEFB27